MIKSRSLSFSYGDGTEAIANVDINLEQGEFIALMGANGCGKTTLLKLLIGLLKPSSGYIYLDDCEYSTLKQKNLFQRIGMLFQDPNDQLFATTVIEDVAFGALNSGMSANETAVTVDTVLSDLGISELKHRAIHTLSFGQKRRVALAGVLAMNPQIILLDEPSGGLDPLGVTAIMKLLRGLNRDKSIGMIMATHDVDLVPLYCDRMIIMQKGHVIAQGKPSEIMDDPAYIRHASLRLPRIAHLFEILSNEDKFIIDSYPLTIGEARRAILKMNNNETRSIKSECKQTK